MKAWLCIPSARPVAEVEPVVAKWRERGYGVALQRDLPPTERIEGALVYVRQYLGYADAVNFLSRQILADHPEVDWIVAGGDDTFPDPNKTAGEIAAELTAHFGGTFGVEQNTGDEWADNLGKIIDRIAGSPFLGRDWCRRAHGGKGPLWPEFRHQFVDEALQVYAQSLGVFLQRPDLTHYHAHAQRIPGTNLTGNAPAPAHMKEWNSQKHWHESKAIFERLKSTNFAECQPIL